MKCIRPKCDCVDYCEAIDPYSATPICSECNEKCNSVEETFDYSGTHCTHGRSGTHRTGVYVSDCCLAEITG